MSDDTIYLPDQSSPEHVPQPDDFAGLMFEWWCRLHYMYDEHGNLVSTDQQQDLEEWMADVWELADYAEEVNDLDLYEYCAVVFDSIADRLAEF